MKKVLIAAICVASSLNMFAQGLVNFANIAGGVNAPITNSVGVKALGTDNITAQLYIAPAGSTLFSSFTPLAGAFTNNVGNGPAGAGYFLGDSAGYAIPGVAAGGSEAFIIAAFVGSDYSSALIKGLSNPVTVVLGGGAQPAANLAGINGFQVVASVPEPSTIVLGVLGGAALLFRRRK
jgi:hypothetical protein